MSHLFRMSDCKEDHSRFPTLVSEQDAPFFNRVHRQAIFRTVNSFFYGKRSITNLARINSFYAEIDDRPKENQLTKIYEGLEPSRIVESKRGFQIYWNVHNACAENYKAIQEGLCSFYLADPKAKDLARMLREPGYYHWKDPYDPFLVKEIHRSSAVYSEWQIIHFYNIELEKRKSFASQSFYRLQPPPSGSVTDFSLWQKISSLNCHEALMRLSGHPMVNFETYTFRRCSNGNLNIFVNGKSTSCWIDRNNQIGSLNKGGPTIYNWLRFYGHEKETIKQFLAKEFFL